MRVTRVIAVAMVCVGVSLVSHVVPQTAHAEPLFDGTTLAGWEGDTHVWRVEDGQILPRVVGIRG